jgi:predicted ATPase
LALDTGSFLPNDQRTEWNIVYREQWNTTLSHSWLKYAKLCRETDAQEAVLAYRRALDHDLENEDLHIELMNFFIELGDYVSAKDQYEQLTRILLSRLNVTPTVSSQAAYHRLISIQIPRHLPEFPLKLIGRNALLDQFDVPNKTRLISVVGMAGMGKTRFAVALASRWLIHFPDGVWFISLAEVASQAEHLEVLLYLLAVLQIPIVANQAPLETLQNALTNKRMLFILDNCEHLIPQAIWLADTLLQFPQIHLLVTSRVPLCSQNEPSPMVYQGEVVVDLPMLELPDVGSQIPSAAMQFFIERAKMVRPTFDFRPHFSSILQICRALGGWPLGLELAAARIKILSPQEIAQQLSSDHIVDLLSEQSFSEELRHATLERVFSWSFALLSKLELQVCIALAVCRGGADLEMIAAVCQLDNPLPILSKLYDHALIRTQTTDGVTRYFQLEPIRQFALMYAQKDPVQPDLLTKLQDHFLQYCLERVQEKGLQIKMGDLGEAKAWLTRESVNWQAALQDALLKPPMDLLLLYALWQYWTKTSRQLEGDLWHQRVLEQYPDDAPNDLELAKAFNGACGMAWSIGSFERAKRDAQRSLRMFQALGEQRHVAVTQSNLAALLFMDEQFEEAVVLLEQVTVVFKAHNDQISYCNALVNLGLAHRELDQYPAARACLVEALVIRKQSQESFDIAQAQVNLGLVLSEMESAEHDEAEELLIAGLQLAQKHHAHVVVAYALDGLAQLWLDQEPDGAVRWFAAAAGLRQAIAFMLPSIHQKRQAKLCARAQALVPKQFEALWNQGQQATLEDIIEEVLQFKQSVVVQYHMLSSKMAPFSLL